MGGPWEDYAPQAETKGPWEDYAPQAETKGPWGDNNQKDSPVAADQPEAPQEPGLLAKTFSNTVPVGQNAGDLLGHLVNLGRKGNQFYQDAAGKYAEHVGEMSAGENPSLVTRSIDVAPAVGISMLGELNPFLPQSRFAAALALLGPVTNLIKSVHGNGPAAVKALRGLLNTSPELDAELEQVFNKNADIGHSGIPPLPREVPAASASVPNTTGAAAMDLPQAPQPLSAQNAEPAVAGEFSVPDLGPTASSQESAHEISVAGERVDPESAARVARELKGRGMSLQNSSALTQGEKDLLARTGNRLALAQELTGRARNGLTEEELAEINRAHSPITPQPAPHQIPAAGRVQPLPANPIEMPKSETLKVPPAQQSTGPTPLPEVAPAAVQAPEPDSVQLQKLGEYVPPTKTQKLIGAFAAKYAGSNPRLPDQIAHVLADGTIMSDATPSMAKVGEKYQAVFKKMGQVFDSKTYQEITGSRYAPDEAQLSKFKNILQDAATKLENAPETLTASEAFLARSAGKKALLKPGSDARLIGADVAKLDTFLENNGVPQIKALSREYARAAAKEALSDIVPRNKYGDPSAVRSFIIAHYGKEAVEALLEGKIIKAGTNAAAGAMMSPAVQGKVLPFLAGGARPALKAAVPLATKAALQNMGKLEPKKE